MLSQLGAAGEARARPFLSRTGWLAFPGAAIATALIDR
jgi:hypothetical protein